MSLPSPETLLCFLLVLAVTFLLTLIRIYGLGPILRFVLFEDEALPLEGVLEAPHTPWKRTRWAGTHGGRALGAASGPGHLPRHSWLLPSCWFEWRHAAGPSEPLAPRLPPHFS